MAEIPFRVRELGKALRGIHKGNRRPPRPADVEPMRAAERARHLGIALLAAALLLAAAAHGYGLQPGDQCIPKIHSVAYRELPSGHFDNLWVFYFTEAGTVQLIIRANVSSNVPVKLAIYNAQGQEIWAAQPSTQIVGDHRVYLKAPGSYELRIENPSSANARILGTLDVTMCGGPAVESWLRQYIKSAIEYATLNGVETPMAPMGIAVYGVKKDRGQYSTYTLTTDAVKGIVDMPRDISASCYRPNGTYYGQAFSVQLNAFVVARLKDGTVQYYWTQNVVGFFDENKKSGIWNKIWRNIQRPFKHKRLGVSNNIRDVTTAPSTLDKSKVRGKGEVYGKPAGSGNFYVYVYDIPNSIPFGRIELEMRTRADDGKIIVEFYANGQKYDEVVITPDVPATSAYIEVAPATTPRGRPLNLELVLAGYNMNTCYAVLKRGQIGLKLYVRMNGAWVPPPSAWSVGSATHEASHARVEPQGVGSAIVKRGAPNPRQLWSSSDFDPP